MTYNRYDNAKIYRITNNANDLVYIGSTCLPLRKRLFNHKKEQHSGRGANRRLFKLAQEIGWDEMTMTLVEAYPCKSKEELCAREEYHRKQVSPELQLNMIRAHATKQDRKDDNQQSRERNRGTYNEYQREYFKRPHVAEYRAKWEQQHRDERLAYHRHMHHYKQSWGGRYHNCLLYIDTTLFT